MRTYGVERERFIVNCLGDVVPEIGTLLPKIHKLAKKRGIKKDLFTYELFAGQVEDRTLPCKNLAELENALIINDRIMEEAANELGLSFDYSEIIERKRIKSLKVNPFDQRHKNIWKTVSLERKIAASVVIATHVHISVSNNEAVKLINACRKDVVNELIRIGDHSNFKRINAYRVMADTEGVPPRFSTFAEIIEYINARGGEKNVWDLVRYKPSTKTVEFRMFGSTKDTKEIIGYVESCPKITKI